MKVLVALALPQRQVVVEVDLADGSTVSDALDAAGLAERCPGVDVASLATGIWSRRCARDAVLREGDRVELYRPLPEDPKQMRRARARKPR